MILGNASPTCSVQMKTTVDTLKILFATLLIDTLCHTMRTIPTLA